jgi:hypothetical protein
MLKKLFFGGEDTNTGQTSRITGQLQRNTGQNTDYLPIAEQKLRKRILVRITNCKR